MLVNYKVMVSTTSLFRLCLSRALYFTIRSSEHMKGKWDIIQRKERAEILSVWTAVGSSSVSAGYVVGSALTFAWYVTASQNSRTTHAETHSHDWLLLSEEPSWDAHRLKGVCVSASGLSCVSLWHFDRPTSVTDWTKCRIAEDTLRDICIDVAKMYTVNQIVFTVLACHVLTVCSLKKMLISKYYISL